MAGFSLNSLLWLFPLEATAALHYSAITSVDIFFSFFLPSNVILLCSTALNVAMGTRIRKIPLHELMGSKKQWTSIINKNVGVAMRN